MKFKLTCAVAAALAAAACASTPEPEAVPPAPVAPTPAGPAPGTVGDFVENVGERVFYDFDSYELTSEARNTLKKQAAWLQSYAGVKVLVAGNCDERGTREYNLALGARRANAAKDYLVSLGIDASRITTISYGKERPLDPASNERAWALNRNAHTQIVSGASS